MTRIRRLITLALVLPLAAFAAQAADLDSVIARARSYVGKERDLDAVRSLRYEGRIEIKGAKEASGTLVMLLEKPGSQLTTRVLGDQREIVGYDGMEGWMRVESVSKPALSRTDMLPLAQLRMLRANVVENLGFYRGMEKVGARLESRGDTTLEGQAAVKVAFIHPGNIVFVRTFARDDGRLLLTEGPGGETIREEGEMEVAGLRFPQRLVSTGKTADGSEVVITITFDAIKVNETFASGTFSVPMPGSK